ncbi:hypothetical protein Tco_0454367 [Tanacetum coccineum]
MKVHPSPLKPKITIRYNYTPQPTTTTSSRQKKLQRLPHIFTKVLELPFYADAEVTVMETCDSFKFVVDTDIAGEIGASTIEICPGVTKTVVGEMSDEVEIDVWRFRLPEMTVPEMATARFSDGELVVVVPKG